MATVLAPPEDRKASERKFYSRMALFLVLLVFLGFAPSFYLRGVVPPYPRPNPTLPPSVILHGTVFTTWMALIVAQTQLIGARKHAVHMQLGKAGMLFAILMIPIMYLTAVWQVARANQPPFTDPLTWTIVPLVVIIPFAVLVWSGWRNRRDAQTHKRLMLIAMIGLLAPSFGRMPWPPEAILPVVLIGSLLVYLAPLATWDMATRRRLHPATIGGGAALIGSWILRFTIWRTAAWLAFAGWAASLVR